VQDPLQIYYSASLFTPTASPVRTQVGNGVPRWMQKLPKVDKHWRSPLALTTGSRVMAVGFVPGGDRLVSASEGGTIRVWDIYTGRILTQRELLSRIEAAKFSADCKLLASVDERKLTLWDVLSGQEKHVLGGRGEVEEPHSLVFSPDGKRLAWYTGDRLHRHDWHIENPLILYDSEKGSCLKKHYVSSISYAVFSPDGGQLAFFVYSKVLLGYTKSENKPKKLGKLVLVSETVCSETACSFVTAAYFPDGKQLIASWKQYAGTQFAVGLWNTESGQLIKKLTNPASMVVAAAFSPDCTLLALTGSKYGAAILDVESGDMERLLIPERVLRDLAWQQNFILFSPDYKQVAAFARETVRVWSIRARNEHETVVGHGNAVTAMELSPNGRQLASASNDMMIKLWDPFSGKETKRLSGHTGPITAMTFSPDGVDLVTASADETIRFWNTISGEEVAKLSRYGRGINTIASSPNGTQLLWASPEGGVRLCEISWRRSRKYGGRGILRLTKKPKRLEGITSPVTTVAFSVNGEQQAFGSEDGIVRLRNNASKKFTLLEGHSARISAVAFLPDGKQLTVASSDKAVTLWDIISGLQLQKVTLLAPLSSLKISSDGQSMETDRGTFNLPAFFSGSQQSGQNPPGNIFFAVEWIYRGSQRLLWLPHEYRGRCWVVRGNLVVIGQELGAVIFLEFRDEVVD
jgi:WD40 repeat protein